jgi:hypothetical protein
VHQYSFMSPCRHCFFFFLFQFCLLFFLYIWREQMISFDTNFKGIPFMFHSSDFYSWLPKACVQRAMLKNNEGFTPPTTPPPRRRRWPRNLLLTFILGIQQQQWAALKPGVRWVDGTFQNGIVQSRLFGQTGIFQNGIFPKESFRIYCLQNWYLSEEIYQKIFSAKLESFIKESFRRNHSCRNVFFSQL